MILRLPGGVLLARSVFIFNLFIPIVFLFLTPEKNEWWFENISYFILLFLTLAWARDIIEHIQRMKPEYPKLIRNYGMGLFAALLLSAIVFISVGPGFRTLTDETDLISVSNSLARTRTAVDVKESFHSLEDISPILSVETIRPLLFPFLGSLLHTVFGIHHENLYLLNYLAMAVFLAATFMVCRRKLDFTSSLAAMILLCSQPIFTIYGTSAGFDFFSALFFYIVLVSLFFFMEEPTSTRFGLLWMQVLLFANVRYESLPLSLLLLGLLVVFGYAKRELFENLSWRMTWTPIFLLPLVWQAKSVQGGYDQRRFQDVFSFSSFLKNAKILIASLFDWHWNYPYSPLISVAAVFGLLYLLTSVGIRKESFFKKRSHRHFSIILTLLIFAQLLIFLFHYQGDPSNPVQARYYIAFALSLVFLSIFIFSTCTSIFRRGSLLVFAVINFILYHPFVVEGRYTHQSTLVRETNKVLSWIKSYGTRDFMMISSTPGVYLALDYGAISFKTAREEAGRILVDLDEHAYSDILVLQNISNRSGSPKPDQQLPPEFNLETLKEIEFTQHEFLRLSRVKRGDEVVPPDLKAGL